MADLTAHEASAEAIHKTRNAQQAVETARELQMSSAMDAALKRYFGPDNRFIDVTAVPRICQDTKDMRESILNIEKTLQESFVRQESFTPVRNVVYGMVGLILTTVVLALLAFVISS